MQTGVVDQEADYGVKTHFRPKLGEILWNSFNSSCCFCMDEVISLSRSQTLGEGSPYVGWLVVAALTFGSRASLVQP